MKKLLSILVLMLLMLISNLFSKELVKKIDSKSIKEISVNLKTGGTIKLTGKDKQKNIILKIISEKTILENDLTISKNNNKLLLVLRNISNENLKVKNINIILPVNINARLKTNGGNIIISNINGEINGRTLGGNINLSNLKGFVKLKTAGGNINLDDSKLNGNVTSMGGNVFFNNVKGNIKGTTMGGNVIYDNSNIETSNNGKKQAININTKGGDIDINKAPYGANVKTSGGNIDIKSAKYFVKAETNGGNIFINSIQGSTRAITKGGNIIITINEKEGIIDYKTYLRSLKGNITVYVPEDLSMLIESEIIYTKEVKKNYQIISDVKLAISHSKNWIEKDGFLIKKIIGSATIKDGKNKIIIKTVNGNINIKINRSKS